MILYLIKGIIVGLAASIPLGPIGVLCIQRTLNKGFYSGLMTGFGATLGDVLYSIIALSSMVYVNLFLEDYHEIVMILGGLIVIGFGIKILMTNPLKRVKNVVKAKYFADMGTSFLMTVTNPGALLLILGLFSYVGINTDEFSFAKVAITVCGVALGSGGWWFGLSSIINFFRGKFRLRQLLTINRISGVAIALIGLLTLSKGLYVSIYPIVKEYFMNLFRLG